MGVGEALRMGELELSRDCLYGACVRRRGLVIQAKRINRLSVRVIEIAEEAPAHAPRR